MRSIVELLVIVPTPVDDIADPVDHSVSLAGTIVYALPPVTAAHMLGVWFSADGSILLRSSMLKCLLYARCSA